MKPAAFLDRDGVINRDTGYLYRWQDFEFMPGIIELMQRLDKLGFALVIVTNQSGIGRGFYSDQQFQQLMSKLKEQLASHGLVVHYFYCPHAPEEQGRALCSCRKPLPGLFYQAQEQLQLDLNRSLMIGDRLTDLQAAAAAGVPERYLISSDHIPEPDTWLMTQQFDHLHAFKRKTK